MAETWEETKARLRKQGIDLKKDIVDIEPPKVEVVQHNRRKEDKEPPVKRFNIHKRSLPVGIDKLVVFSVTKQEAEWWLEHRLKPKCYENEPEETKTVVYYDIIPIGATPKERSIYHNPGLLTTEPVLGYAPRRIN